MKPKFISFLEACAVPALFILLLTIVNYSEPLEIWIWDFFFGGLCSVE